MLTQCSPKQHSTVLLCIVQTINLILFHDNIFWNDKEIIIIMNTEKTKQKMRGGRLWWWDFNPENIYAFHEEEDIKLI